jgi:precorrin-3B synthase
METGDGLLVRLRPASGFFSPAAFIALLNAAETFGNGRLDITARGNLQIRGLSGRSVPGLSAAVDAAGIVAREGVAIETPPLAGLDRSEIADPRQIAARLKALVDARALVLAPKLSIVVDGGGILHLGDLAADLRIVAALEGEQEEGPDDRRQHGESLVAWHLLVDGRDGPRLAASGGEAAILDSAMGVLGSLSALSPSARARDLDDAASWTKAPVRVLQARPATAVGTHRVAAGAGDGLVLGLAPSFGQLGAAATRGLVTFAQGQGLTEIRLAPGRALLFLGLAAAGLDAVVDYARQAGFVTDATDPSLRIDACAGAGACASSAIGTQATARRLMERGSALMDGSVDVHISGCAKGCARPRAATLAIVGSSGGAGIVLHGSAGATPIATCGHPALPDGLERLAQLVAQAKQSGESAASCLKRLGPARIAASFQRD